MTRLELEALHKKQRQDRLNNKVYGVIKPPVLQSGMALYRTPPSYLSGRATASRAHAQKYRNMDIDINQFFDFRCFYTGIMCTQALDMGRGVNHSAAAKPWIGTRDHMVPARRRVPGCPIDISKYPPSNIWCSNVVNMTLGLVPLPIRLKIRQWLMTSQYDHSVTTLESGENMKWIIIDMINEFRINNRFPWSRKANGSWWYPEYSTPLMTKWWNMELEFLELDEERRNDWIENFVYHF